MVRVPTLGVLTVQGAARAHRCAWLHCTDEVVHTGSARHPSWIEAVCGRQATSTSSEIRPHRTGAYLGLPRVQVRASERELLPSWTRSGCTDLVSRLRLHLRSAGLVGLAARMIRTAGRHAHSFDMRCAFIFWPAARAASRRQPAHGQHGTLFCNTNRPCCGMMGHIDSCLAFSV